MNPRQLRRLEKRKAHEARVAANRANAALSTGPKTEEGKAVSARNHFQHGLTGAFCVLPSESREEFEQLVHSLFEEHQPQTPTENVLVNDLARHHWLLQRALRLQEASFTGETVDDKKLALYLRYQTTHQRAFHKALDELRKIRNQRFSEKRRFESQLNDAACQQSRAMLADMRLTTERVRQTGLEHHRRLHQAQLAALENDEKALRSA